MIDWITGLSTEGFASLLSYTISVITSFYWALLGIRYPPRQSERRSYPSVSLLIPAHNAEKVIGALLKSLRSQQYPASCEVILVLDRCTDKTKTVVQEAELPFPLRIIEIERVPQSWTPKRYALWQAAAQAQYEWCVVLDADVEVGNQWLIHLMEGGEGRVAGLGRGWLKAGDSFFSWIAAYEAALVQVESIGRALWGFPYMSTGRGWAVRREWLKAGLYAWREELSGDDDLTLQLLPKGSIQVTRAWTLSPAPSTFLAAFYRKWRHLQSARHYPFGLQLSLAIPPFLQVVLLLLSPFAQIPILFVLLTKMIVLWRYEYKHPCMVWWAEWVVLVLQCLYPIGVWWRRYQW
ncbi:MAG: glycosyltransferase [Bacteroidia bacterium]|nr:glycosyltransferase [Bacteroidia bacterium]MDW8014649.1 glycosyltransferase [Bacteroidia bacterium]